MYAATTRQLENVDHEWRPSLNFGEMQEAIGRAVIGQP